MCNIVTSSGKSNGSLCSFSTLQYLDSHNIKPYCMYGINSELYRNNNILFGKVYFNLFIIPIVFDNFMHTKFVWLVHNIFESNMIPRKLKVDTCAISFLLIDNAISGIILWLVWKIMYFILSALVIIYLI